MVGTGKFSFPKPTKIVQTVIEQTESQKNSLILDYFAGSGTTGHAVINLNRADGEDGKRRFVLAEQGRYFDSVLVPRLKKAAFAERWKGGRPADFVNRVGVAQTLLMYGLESYEDALEHLAAAVEESAGGDLFTADDDWTVRYALSVDTKAGELPLSDALFRTPFGMQMRVGGTDAGTARVVTPDAVATFTWLLGLRVHKMWFPSETLGAVCGLLPDGRAAVTVWRHLDSVSYEDADAALSEFWQHDEILAAWRAEHAPEVVYVNGDSTLGAHKGAGEAWEVASLEAEFRRLMFAPAPAAPEMF